MFTSSAIAAALIAIAPASAAVIDVFVGGAGVLKFTPEHVTAYPGDSIRFTFGAKNHTVTQSSFDSPCSPLVDAHGMHSGFFSGFMPVAADQTHDLPQFWIPVKDTKPIWAYCQQGNHCQQGMVFAVNAPASPSEKSFDNWKAKAVGKAAGDPYASVAPTTSVPYGYGDYPVATSSAAHVVTSAEPAAATGDPAVVTVTKVIALPSSTWTTVYGSYPGSADPTPAVQPVVHKVIVGGTNGNIFSPSNVMAQPADIISFEFHAKNHTVTQSTFKAPCTKKTDGMDSGFVPTAVDATSFTTWNVTVTGTEPLWFYCAQGNHCAAGMVFSVNAVESSQNNFDAFQSQAKALAQNGGSPTGTGTPAAATTAITNGAAARIGNSGMGGVTVMTIALALIGSFMVC